MKQAKVEVLCVTMHQHGFEKLKQMNLSSDVVFANQSDFTGYDEMSVGPFKARMISTQTRGVGRNRNLALLYAQGDILLFADDDVCYADGYRDAVLEAYKKRPDADMIIFSMDITESGKVIRKVTAPEKRLHVWNSMRYGTYVMSIRRTSFERANLWFSVLFGGGTEHGHGEDTLFLAEAFRKKLKVYGSSACLGVCAKDQSTCFHGYDARYFFDFGWLYALLFGPMAELAALRFCIKSNKKYGAAMSFLTAFRSCLEGIKDARKRQ